MTDQYRTLTPGQRAQIWLGGPQRPSPELIYETDTVLIEAPNWATDGASLILNGHGTLWRYDVTDPGTGLTAILLQDVPPLNNDHVLDPDGQRIYMSAMDGHIYRAHLSGGTATKVTPEDGQWHFLHGVSPDGARLAYVQISDLASPGQLAILPPHGRPQLVNTGTGHIDGPEWSPDGSWIYFNTESFSSTAGHAQLARIPDPGGTPEQLVTSDTVDWFPHLSPNGQWASYVSFPAGTLGHPADLAVEVKVVSTADWSTTVQAYPVPGGQGTINVNSWAPDSDTFAFIAYPFS